MKLSTSTMDAAGCVSMSLLGERDCGQRLLVQVVVGVEDGADAVVEAVRSLYARFAEEAKKPATSEPAAPPERDPILDDPTLEFKTYDDLYREAAASGQDPQTYITAFVKTGGWSPMPNHAAMQRKRPEAS